MTCSRILPTLRGYRRAQLRGDVVAGLTVAALVLPLGMALAVTAGLPAEAGLYGSLVSLVAFALASSSRRTMVGPDASVTALVLAALLPMSGGGARHVELVSALGLIAGALCILAAIARAGRLARVLTESALVGYLAGLAVVVGVSQLSVVAGLGPARSERTLQQLADLVRDAPRMEGTSIALGAATLALVVLARARGSSLPWMLFAIVGAALTTWALELHERGVRLVGELPAGMPTPAFPDLPAGDWVGLVPLAAAVVLVTFADTLATSAAFAHRHGEQHDAGSDLIGLGLADLASGAVGGLPASASGARTAAADSAGGSSQLTGLVAAVGIVVVLAGGADALAWLPRPALAAIVIAAVLPMVDVQSLARMRRLDSDALRVAILVLAVVVLVGVLEGILAAFVASFFERRRRADTMRA